jgi:hypothetical protein
VGRSVRDFLWFVRFIGGGLQYRRLLLYARAPLLLASWAVLARNRVNASDFSLRLWNDASEAFVRFADFSSK